MPTSNGLGNRDKPEKPDDGFDQIIDEEIRLVIVGAGNAGLRAVRQMAGRTYNTDCIGLQITPGDGTVSADFAFTDLTKANSSQLLDLKNLPEIFCNSDLIFLVAALDTGLDNCIFDFCSAIHEKAIRIILVTPEPEYDNGPSGSLSEPYDKLRAVVSGMILVSERSLFPLGLTDTKGLDDTAMLDYLIRVSVDKIIAIITMNSFQCADFSDVAALLLGDGITRVGIGAASGPGRAVSATIRACSALERQGSSLIYAPRILCNISGSSDITIEDYNRINRLFHDSINEESYIKLSVTRHDDMSNNLMVVIWAVMIEPDLPQSFKYGSS